MRFLLVIFLLSSYCASASINNDSLIAIWNKPSNPIELRLKALDIYLQPMKAKMGKNADILIDSFCVIAKEYRNPHYILQSYIHKGRREYLKSDYLNAISFFEKVIDMSLIAKDTSNLVKGYNGLGICYMHLGKIEKANESYFKSLDVLKLYSNETEKNKQIRLIYNNISGLFYKLKQYDEAFEYSRLSLVEGIKEKNWSAAAGGYINLSIFSKDKGDIETAILYLDSSQYIIDNKKGVDPLFESIGMSTLAEILLEKKDTVKAIEKLNEALHKVREIGNIYHEVVILIQMEKLESDSASINTLKIALKKANEIISEDLQMDIYMRLYNQYKKIDKQDLALEMLEYYNELDKKSDNSKSLSQLLKYENSRKNEKLEKVNQNKIQNLVNNYSIKIYLILLLTIIALVGIFMFFRIRLKNQKIERELLLNEIDVLKSEGLKIDSIYLMKENNDTYIDNHEIEQIFNDKLNETDIIILNIIYNDHSLPIKQIGEKMNLSYEGVRSALKKMYRLFDVPNSKNMKLALVLKVMTQIKNVHKQKVV